MALALQHTRASVRWTSALDIVAGLWMVAAPFLLGYVAITSAFWNSVIAGVAIVLFASSRETRTGYKNAAPSWITAAIGVWLIVAPIVLGFSAADTAFWNHVIIGIAVTVFALWSALSTPRERI